jgi:hypothetical protein
VERLAKTFTIGFVSVLTIIGGLWWFAIGQPEAASKWVRRVGGSHFSGYPMGYPGVDLSKADPARIDADGIFHLASLHFLGSLRLANNRNGDELAAEIARWRHRNLTQLEFDNVTLTERGYASLVSLCRPKDKESFVSLHVRRMEVPAGGVRAIAAAACPIRLQFHRATLDAEAATALDAPERFNCRWLPSQSWVQPQHMRSGVCTLRLMPR